MGGVFRSKISVGVLALATVLVGEASADILVMKSATGDTFISNRGSRSGYRVIKRMREFPGSSGMGLRGLKGGDSGQFDSIIREAAESVELDPNLVKAVVRAESNFQPRALSRAGAMGLMQLMPATARMHGVRDAYDPRDNIYGGVRHLSYLVDRYAGNVELVLAAYNAGTKPVDRVGGIPNYPETQYYVRRVQELKHFYSGSGVLAKPATPTEIVASLDWQRARAEDFYGKPLVFRGPGAMRRKVGPPPNASKQARVEKLLRDENRAFRGAHLGIVGNEQELDAVLECRLEPNPPNRSCHAPVRVAIQSRLWTKGIVVNDDPALRTRR